MPTQRLTRRGYGFSVELPLSPTRPVPSYTSLVSHAARDRCDLHAICRGGTGRAVNLPGMDRLRLPEAEHTLQTTMPLLPGLMASSSVWGITLPEYCVFPRLHIQHKQYHEHATGLDLLCAGTVLRSRPAMHGAADVCCLRVHCELFFRRMSHPRRFLFSGLQQALAPVVLTSSGASGCEADSGSQPCSPFRLSS